MLLRRLSTKGEATALVVDEYCNVPAATAGIWTPLLRSAFGIGVADVAAIRWKSIIRLE